MSGLGPGERNRSPWPPPTVAVAAGPAGWYDDPHRRAGLRWWDGATWTDHEHGAPGVPLRAALAGLALLAAVRLLLELVLRALRPDDVPVWLLALGFYALVFGAMVLTARRWLWPGSTLRRWVRGQVRAVDVGWGLLVWMTTIASAVVTVSLIQGFGLPFRSNGDVVEAYRDRDPALFAVTMVAAVLAAPIVEELFFRGLTLRGASSRVPGWAAVLVQGVLFGLYHLIPGYGAANVGLVLVLTGYGCVFGAWAQRMGRLGPTMVGHAVTNTLVLVILLVR